jgi:hypothetical protein
MTKTSRSEASAVVVTMAVGESNFFNWKRQEIHHLFLLGLVVHDGIWVPGQWGLLFWMVRMVKEPVAPGV